MDTKTLEKLQRIYDQADSFGKSIMEKEFPELTNSEDERIKRCIGMCLTDATEKRFKDFNTTLKDCLSWLEKQYEKNHIELPNGEDYGIDSLYHALQILQATLGEVAGYQSDDGILEHKCAISAVKKLYTQIVWSKEDEEIFNETLYFINEYQKSDKCKDENGMQNSVSCEKWLCTIKSRLTYGQEE